MTDLVCLIGRHGSGKTTIGTAMEQAGFQHISLGLLKRFARNGLYPSDIPLPLMLELKRQKSNSILPLSLAQKLVQWIQSFPRCVIDGFPASPEHLPLLPEHTVIVYVYTPRIERERRLKIRSENSRRLWIPGGKSLREAALPELVVACRHSFVTIFLKNDDPTILTDRLLKKIGQSLWIQPPHTTTTPVTRN